MMEVFSHKGCGTKLWSMPYTITLLNCISEDRNVGILFEESN